MESESKVNPSVHLVQFLKHDNLTESVKKLVTSENAKTACNVNFYPLGKIIYI